MDLSQAQAERLNRGIDLLFQRLNGNIGVGYSQQDLPYRLCRMEDPRIAFGVSHRAPIGSRHPDGSKWKTYNGPWVEDCQLIVQIARTPEEVASQFHRCIFEGARPMHTKGGQLVNEETINAIVNAKIAEIMAKMGVAQTPIAPAAKQIEAVEAAEAKAWAPPARATEDSMQPSLIETWAARAETLGLSPPKLAKGGRIDGRWMRNAQDKWRAYQAAKNPEPTGAA